MPTIVDDGTSIAQLGPLVTKFGVTRISFDYDYTHPKGPRCAVTIVTGDVAVTGTSTGKTQASIEAEAFDDALSRLKHVLGARITVDGTQNGESAKWDL